MKKQMDILEFKGYSGSGKTESIIALIKYLKSRSYNVISLKSIHIKDFSVDTPGKNTWRMSEAGAEPVISVAPNETAFIVKQKLDLEAVIKISTVIAQEKKRLEIMSQGQTNTNENTNTNNQNTTNTNNQNITNTNNQNITNTNNQNITNTNNQNITNTNNQ
ncbi:MAG: molybdopterin-guanine dinucleotide biosynthesis protein B, partial [Promethearchaeota archaeon]